MRESENGNHRLGVFILDDHELVRIGLRDLLEGEGMRVVGESASAREAARRIPALRPDVAILDRRLADGTGIEVCREVRSVDPGIRCLILTGHDEEDALREAVLAGAAGYLVKQVRSGELAEAVRRAAAGGSLFSEADRRRALESAVEGAEDPRLEVLSPQQRRVLSMIGNGMTNREIAGELHVAEKTVKNYVSQVLAHLGLETRTQAALYLVRSGRRRTPPAETG